MKFGRRVDLYVMLVSSCGFLGSRCSERDTLLGGISEILPVFFLWLSSDLERNRYRRCSRNLWSVCDFRENRYSETRSSRRGVK
jgi:hypothetical protein